MAAAPAERRFGDAAAAAAALAADVAGALQAGIDARGSAGLALSGGRSPVAFLQALSARPLPWPQVFVTLVDERWVEPASPDSNEHLLRSHLLRGPAAAARFVPLKTAHADPGQAIADRTQALAAMPHPLDVVVLGMGEDGHTASLFAGAPGIDAALDPHGSAALAAIVPPLAWHPRLSFTLAALLDARRIVLQIEGAAKLAVYARARRGADPALPISLVLANATVPVTVYLVG
ncbi:MAG: 6-phosphogluconolactonase [Nevskia sp.]|nr:6-phosphogluconolactonase [Nevskia sp.]